MDHALDGANNAVVRTRHAEMVEHHRAGPNGSDGIGDATPRDVWRRAMNGFKHGGMLTLRVDVGPRRNTKTAGDRRAEIGENVAEQVGRDDHVERVRMRDHAGGQRIDVILAPFHRGVIGRDRFHALIPEHHAVLQCVRFCRAG